MAWPSVVLSTKILIRPIAERRLRARSVERATIQFAMLRAYLCSRRFFHAPSEKGDLIIAISLVRPAHSEFTPKHSK
jgi:hypothetical protein